MFMRHVKNAKLFHLICGGNQTYASAHNCLLNSACCALLCAFAALEDIFFSGSG